MRMSSRMSRWHLNYPDLQSYLLHLWLPQCSVTVCLIEIGTGWLFTTKQRFLPKITNKEAIITRLFHTSFYLSTSAARSAEQGGSTALHVNNISPTVCRLPRSTDLQAACRSDRSLISGKRLSIKTKLERQISVQPVKSRRKPA